MTSGPARVVIPGKPGYRIVIASADDVHYEHVETGAREPITLSTELRTALAAVDDPSAADSGTPTPRA